MASTTIDCESCGERFESESDLEVVEGVRELDPRSFNFGPAQRDVYRCSNCGAILGVKSESASLRQ